MPDSPDGANLVQDDRRPPFCYQTHDALAVIRATFEGAKLSTALAVYLCLTEAANRDGGAEARGNGFAASRRVVAAAAGISKDTLDRYAADFVKAGLLLIERRPAEVEGMNLPNRWRLLDPAPVPPVAAPLRPPPGRVDAAQELKETTEVRKDLSPIAPRAANRPAAVDRKPVKDDEYDLAAQVLASFNSQAGTRYGSRDFIAKIVMRIREHPSLPLDAHEAVIAASLAMPWWKGPASPAVIYGNAALFERSVHVAASDPSDAPMTPEQMRAAAPAPHADVEAEAQEVHD